MSLERIKIMKILWENEIKAETGYSNSPKMKSQIEHCIQNSIPYLIIVGENEINEGIVKIKVVDTKEEFTIDRNFIVDFINSY